MQIVVRTSYSAARGVCGYIDNLIENVLGENAHRGDGGCDAKRRYLEFIIPENEDLVAKLGLEKLQYQLGPQIAFEFRIEAGESADQEQTA
jgi:hypothetical protein